MCDIEACRICLNTGVRGYKLEEHSLRSYYEYVMRLKVTCNDSLPQWLCYECAVMLHKFHKFKEKCHHGQALLKQMAWKGQIDYEMVAITNRFAENLSSPLANAIPSHRVKTITTKHKHKTKMKVKELEKILLNVDNDILEVKKINILDTIDIDDTKCNEKVLEKVEIKMETPLKTLKVEDAKDNKVSISSLNNKQENLDVTNTNFAGNANVTNTVETTTNFDTKDDLDMDNTDHIDNAQSSDDENIFLDIVKKAVKGENKLVFLDNIEAEPVKKKRKYTRRIDTKGQRKFERRKQELLSDEHWKKFNLTEEEAMQEFKQREQHDQYVNANYKCHICYKGFSKVEMLLRHAKFRHDESNGPFECRFCHMRFNQKNKLCKHTKQHYTIYQCLRCDMRFRLESSATFHEDYHNGVLRKCEYCGEEFKHSSTYYTHVRMSHRSAHVCVACGASFVSAAGLQQHARIKHYDNTDSICKVRDTGKIAAIPQKPFIKVEVEQLLHLEPTNKEAIEEVNTYCSKCDIKFATLAAYDEHLTHSDMHADLNAEPGTARVNMKGNKRIVQSGIRGLRKKKPTTCQYCGKHFSTQGQCMKHHLAEHPRRSFYPPDKRHICEICGQSLAAVSIASHMNRHTREHVYPCATCGMQFYSKSSHHRHQVTHTGERPYPCPLCEKRFTQRNSMKLHYRTFHLKQPYPKRNRRKKTDVEMPIMECAINRDRVPQVLERERDRDMDTNHTPPATRWRPTF